MTTAFRPACDRTHALLSRKLDGTLSELERRAVAAHTARCASCRAFARESRWFTDELRRAPLVPLPRPVFVAASRRRMPVRAVANVASAAAVLLATVGGLSLALPSGDQGNAQALAPVVDAMGGDVGLREIRRAALRSGELQLLPDSEPDPHGKPLLLATDS